MEAPVFIARIFGIFYLAAAAGLMLNRKFYRKFMEDYPDNAALVFFTGVFALIVGLVIIMVHNVWAADWTVIITLLGWIAFIKGIWIIVFPNTISRFMRVYRDRQGLLLVHSVAALILGIVMTYFGFFT